MHESEQRGGDARRDESEKERLDRNLEELTGELRVVVTGVQVLFAFLLIVPFNTGFEGVGPFERTVYVITLLLAALAAVCMIAPSAEHRWMFRQDDKRHLVFASNRIVLVGMAFLALAMCGCLLLVATKLFGAGSGVLIARARLDPVPVAVVRAPDAQGRSARARCARRSAAGVRASPERA